MVSRYDHDATEPEWALGFRFDIVLRGPRGTPFEDERAMPETPLGLTPSQTVGPFLSIGLPWPDGPDVVAEDTPGAIWIRGRLLDGAGEPVPDGVVETWQADARDGRFDARRFRGFGRSATDADGRCAIHTRQAGRAGPSTAGPRRRTWRVRLRPRPARPGGDPRLLRRRGGGERRRPGARVGPDGRGRRWSRRRTATGTRFDIRLQGDGETVFFDI